VVNGEAAVDTLFMGRRKERYGFPHFGWSWFLVMEGSFWFVFLPVSGAISEQVMYLTLGVGAAVTTAVVMTFAAIRVLRGHEL
jgi:hypothetical protein